MAVVVRPRGSGITHPQQLVQRKKGGTIMSTPTQAGSVRMDGILDKDI